MPGSPGTKKSTLSAHQSLVPGQPGKKILAERLSNGPQKVPRDGFLPVQNFLTDGGSKELHGVLSVGSDRWQRRRVPGRCCKYWIRGRPRVASGPQSSFLPGSACTSRRMLACSGSSDRCSRGVAAPLWPAVVAAAALYVTVGPLTSTGLSLSLTLPGELHHLSSPACHVQTVRVTLQLSTWPARGRLVVSRVYITTATQLEFLEVEPSRTARQSVSRTTPVTGFYVRERFSTAGRHRKPLQSGRTISSHELKGADPRTEPK